ncbi:retrovirus-related pol polyprotein from transposon TNT 1-94 [Tanacetum coccineum]
MSQQGQKKALKGYYGGDIKTMFKPNVEDEVWKMQQVYRVLGWKLFDSYRVHCLTFQSGMIYMLVEQRYPLTPATITEMLNRKLQADHLNEMFTAAKVRVTVAKQNLVLFSNLNEKQAKRHFKTLSLDELRLPNFNLFSDQEYSEEEEAETMAETIEQYIGKTRADYGSGVARPKIEDKDNFELKGQFLKELRTNTFSGSDHEDANEHVEKVLEIVDLFHIPNITIDPVMLRAFPMSLTGAISRWLRNEPTDSITTWDGLKSKILNKYCPPARTAKKMEEINNFQQEPDENLYQA